VLFIRILFGSIKRTTMHLILKRGLAVFGEAWQLLERSLAVIRKRPGSFWRKTWQLLERPGCY
jgi:hypothetical protein